MIAHGLPIYMALEPVNMRLGAERLGALVRERMRAEPERSHTSEAQLALGDLLAAEAQLQKELKAALERAKDAIDPEPDPKPPGGSRNGDKAKPKGRYDFE